MERTQDSFTDDEWLEIYQDAANDVDVWQKTLDQDLFLPKNRKIIADELELAKLHQNQILSDMPTHVSSVLIIGKLTNDAPDF